MKHPLFLAGVILGVEMQYHLYNKGGDRKSPLQINQIVPFHSEITFKKKFDCLGFKKWHWDQWITF